MEQALNFTESLMVRPGDKVYLHDPNNEIGTRTISSEQELLALDHGKEFIVSEIEYYDSKYNRIHYMDFGNAHKFANINLGNIEFVRFYLDNTLISLNAQEFMKDNQGSRSHLDPSLESIEKDIVQGTTMNFFKVIMPNSGVYDMSIDEYISFNRFIRDNLQKPTYQSVVQRMEQEFENEFDEEFETEIESENINTYTPAYDDKKLIPDEDSEQEVYGTSIVEPEDTFSTYVNSIIDGVGEHDLFTTNGKVRFNRAFPDNEGKKEDIEPLIESLEDKLISRIIPKAPIDDESSNNSTYLFFEEEFEEEVSETELFYEELYQYEEYTMKLEKQLAFAKNMKKEYNVTTLGDIRDILLKRELPAYKVEELVAEEYITDPIFYEPAHEAYEQVRKMIE
ncbi:MAG: hypothetical protein ACQESE_05155 [Nanobdellota archaeon]